MIKYWTTRSGRTIRICDMSDMHLINSINYIRRYYDKMIASAYQMESSINPDSDAAWCIDQEISSMENGDPGDYIPEFNDLLDEAIRRGLAIR